MANTNPQGATGAADFLEKYSTVVGMPQAIEELSNSNSQTPGEQGATGTTDAGAGEGTDEGD